MSTATSVLLADANEKHHLLLTGQAALVTVNQNGERVEFAKADEPKLAQYIRTLEAKISGGVRSGLRPIGFVW